MEAMEDHRLDVDGNSRSRSANVHVSSDARGHVAGDAGKKRLTLALSVRTTASEAESHDTNAEHTRVEHLPVITGGEAPLASVFAPAAATPT